MKFLRLAPLFLAAFGALSLSAQPATQPPPSSPGDFTTLPSGVKYAITVHGTGRQVRSGWVIRYWRGAPTLPEVIKVGLDSRFKELEEAFLHFRAGDKGTIIVPPNLAIGNAVLTFYPARFEVEVLDVKERLLNAELREKIDRAGLDEARRYFAESKAAGFPDSVVDEILLNMLGYQYLFNYPEDQIRAAIQVFQWNAELFPASDNVHDSLGEAYAKSGDGARAISSYKMAVELKPGKTSAVAMLAELESGPDAVVAYRERMLLSDEMRASFQQLAKDKNPNLAVLRSKVAAYLAKYPAVEGGGGLAGYFVRSVRRVDEKQGETELRSFLTSPNRSAREMAEAEIRKADMARTPLDLKFAAVDGRAVDFAKLRGKVVLIDFWATWCGPCKAELPNVIANYKKYHDKGFEVVGIALENGMLAPKDTPEQTTAKLAKAKKVLTDFTAKNDMPWPQYFDGKYWKNDISTRYNIQGIPAMFLLDQDGKVVSTNARGELLEKEVKRLLKL